MAQSPQKGDSQNEFAAAANSQSTWKTKFQALGPGILMASAAVGGSHIVASTQAGAIYGWQLAIIIILANLFKYPFFRFGYEYTLTKGESLLEGYNRYGKGFLWVFFLLNVFAAVVNTGGVLIVCAAILKYVLKLGDVVFVGSLIEMKAITFLCLVILFASVALLLAGKYGALDFVSKVIMISLTVMTVLAVLIAAKNGAQAHADIPPESPWKLAALGFIVSLMGWMPAPIEISAITSMWLKAKNMVHKVSYRDGIFDFNVGYIGTALLALVFMTLGWLVQYRTGIPIETNGSKYIAQLTNMYSKTIGGWSDLMVAFIAFACMWGTTITVIDGYSRTNVESVRILTNRRVFSGRSLNGWIIFTSIVGLVIILFFGSAMAAMLKFAMIASFVTTPVFAFLNLLLVKVSDGKFTMKPWLMWLAWAGLVYLSLFTLFYIYTLVFM